MAKRKRVLFITPYPPDEAPSQRFRFEQYLSILRANSIDYTLQSFLTSTNWRVFYEPGNAIRKGIAMANGFWRRTVVLFVASRYDYVFIHREAAPVGPPVFEWIIARILRRRIIYDFDDAIWMTDLSGEGWITRTLKWRSKVASICQMAHRISVGNEYLGRYAKQFNPQVVLNPTTIDTDHLHNPALITAQARNSNIAIGWTGTHSTLKYLYEIADVLKDIENRHANVSFIVIANQKPQLNLHRLTFVPWRESSEINDLMRIDIGLMPLPNDAWSEGKCGFKILQYMALMIPGVSSPVGVNKTIVRHGVNGLLSETKREWIEAIEKLIADPNLRMQFGSAGRATVVESYSVNSNTPTFLSLFE